MFSLPHLCPQPLGHDKWDEGGEFVYRLFVKDAADLILDAGLQEIRTNPTYRSSMDSCNLHSRRRIDIHVQVLDDLEHSIRVGVCFCHRFVVTDWPI